MVDDFFTSGATVGARARLKRAGAAPVEIVGWVPVVMEEGY